MEFDLSARGVFRGKVMYSIRIEYRSSGVPDGLNVTEPYPPSRLLYDILLAISVR